MRKAMYLFAMCFLLCLVPSAYADVLTLPDDLYQISDEAFYGARSLDVVQIPDGTVSIGKRAFAGSGVQRIYLPNTLISIAEDAFLNVPEVVFVCATDSYARSYADAHDNILWENSQGISKVYIYNANNDVREGNLAMLQAIVDGIDNEQGESGENALPGSFIWEKSADGHSWSKLDAAGPRLFLEANEENCSQAYRCRYLLNGLESVSDVIRVQMMMNVAVTGDKEVGKGDVVTLHAAADGAVRYSWEQSADGGETWTAVTLPSGGSRELSFTADEAHCALQYRCTVEGQEGRRGVSDPVSLRYGLNRIEPQKKTMGTLGFSVWGEQNFSFTFGPVPEAERFVVRLSHTPEMSDVFAELDTNQTENIWIYHKDFNYWENISNILLTYTLPDGSTGQFPDQPDSRLYSPLPPEDAVSWECTYYGLPFGESCYVTVEAIADGFEPSISEPLYFQAAKIDSRLKEPIIKQVSISGDLPLIRYELGSGSKVTDVIIFDSYGGLEMEKNADYLDHQQVSQSDFGRWTFWREASTFDRFGLAAYDRTTNTLSRFVWCPHGFIGVTASCDTLTPFEGEYVRMSASVSGSLSYRWEYTDDDYFWLTVESLNKSEVSWYKGLFEGWNTANLRFKVNEHTAALKYRCVVTDAKGNDGLSNALEITMRPDWRKEIPVLKAEQRGKEVQLKWTVNNRAPYYAVYEIVNGQSRQLARVSDLSWTVTSVTDGAHRYQVKGCTGTGSSAEMAKVASEEVYLDFYTPVLNKTELTVYEGTRPTAQLSVRNLSAGQRVKWSSNNTRIMTVSSSGTVTGQAGGNARVKATVTTAYGYAEAEAQIHVNGRTHRALIVGNYDYDNGRNAGMRNDAYVMEAALKRACFDDYGNYNVKTLIDPRKASVRSTISSFFADADENDISFFFFSGHGYVNTSGSYAGALALASGDTIFGSELASWLGAISGQKLVMLDSCGGGALIGRGEEDEGALWCELMQQAFEQEESGGLVSRNGELARSGFHVITAAKTGESAWGSDQGRLTVFTLLGMGFGASDGKLTGSYSPMADTNRDGFVTYLELYNYVKINLDTAPVHYKGKEYYQHVQYYSSQGTVPFYKK